MIRSLIPWTQLTRHGVPDFTVIRRAMLVHGVEVAIGSAVPAEITGHRSRLRQLYEQRKIEPTIAPVGSKQAHRVAATVPPKKVSKPAPASALPFDAPSVPVPQQSGSYQPARKQIQVRQGA